MFQIPCSKKYLNSFDSVVEWNSPQEHKFEFWKPYSLGWQQQDEELDMVTCSPPKRDRDY